MDQNCIHMCVNHADLEDPVPLVSSSPSEPYTLSASLSKGSLNPEGKDLMNHST